MLPEYQDLSNGDGRNEAKDRGGRGQADFFERHEGKEIKLLLVRRVF